MKSLTAHKFFRLPHATPSDCVGGEFSVQVDKCRASRTGHRTGVPSPTAAQPEITNGRPSSSEADILLAYAELVKMLEQVVLKPLRAPLM